MKRTSQLHVKMFHGSVSAILQICTAVVIVDAWQCSSDESCQLAGVCENGVCKCDPAWTGQNCSVLNLGKSHRAYTGRLADTSTWGGAAIKGDDGVYHGYFAEISGHCTLSAWRTNSETIHAKSNTPIGPFTFLEVVQRPWSHNPLPVYDTASETLLIAHIGCGVPKGPMQNCSSVPHGNFSGVMDDYTHVNSPVPALVENVTIDSTLPPCGCEIKNGTPCQTLQILSSRDGKAPWIDKQVAWPLQPPTWPGCLSNPAPLLPLATSRSNTSNLTIMAYNGNFAPPDNHGTSSHPGLLISDNGWQGPYRFWSSPDGNHYLTDRGYAEDPVLYRDHRGHVHMLFHGFYDVFPGGHAWSRDGLSQWEFSSTPAYTFDAVLDGVSVVLEQRERPQVLVEDGVLKVLYNGARVSGEEHTFTLATEINQV
eukprot:m.397379 g.397379  ORF g.397379 m.397379 type:complete len:424 (-) comp21128_c0_seq1:258-1529(-)